MAATGISSKSDAKQQQQQQPGQKVQPAPPVLNKLAGGNFIIKQPSKDSIAGVMMASGGGLIAGNSNRTAGAIGTAMKPTGGSRLTGPVGTGTGGSGE